MINWRVLLLSMCVSLASASCVVTTARQEVQPRVTLSPLFSGDVYNRLALFVIDRTRRFERTGAVRQIEDEFMRALIERGYTVAERSDLDRILEEQKFQRTTITEREIARIGQILNVPAVLIVSVNSVSSDSYQPMISTQGQRYYQILASISARLVTVEEAEVLWISSYSGGVVAHESGRDAQAKVLAPIARIVAKGLPSRIAEGVSAGSSTNGASSPSLR